MIDLSIIALMLYARKILCTEICGGPSLGILGERWISHPWQMSADIGIRNSNQPVLLLKTQLTLDSYPPSLSPSFVIR